MQSPLGIGVQGALLAAFSGDGGSPTSATLNNPTDVAFDSSGCLSIVDGTNSRIRKINLGPTQQPAGTPSISANGIVNGASFEPGIVSNSWATIVGSNLATGNWNHSIVNGKLPPKFQAATRGSGCQLLRRCPRANWFRRLSPIFMTLFRLFLRKA